MSQESPSENQTKSSTSASDFSPLISVSELLDSIFPTVQIPDNKYFPLVEHGARRAVDSPGSIKNHERGILGEFAVASFLGVSDRVDTGMYEFGDPGFDLQVGLKQIDVKTAQPQWKDPSLMVDATKPLSADFYVLAHQLGQKSYRILGYAPMYVVAHSPIRRVGPHQADKVYVVEQHRLFPLSSSSARVFTEV